MNKQLDSSSISTLSKTDTNDFNFSDNQIAMLRSIRNRNQSSLKFMLSSDGYDKINTNTNNNNNQIYSILEQRSKLKLAPANISKFI